MLCNTVREQLLEALIPDTSNRSLQYEVVEGGDENIYAAIERVNTFSLLSLPKIVAIQDARIFYSSQDKGILLSKSKEAHANDDMHRAARYFLSFLGLAGIALEECLGTDWKMLSKAESDLLQPDEWIKEVADYCVDNGQTVPEGEGPLKALENAIAKGFPKDNAIIITTENADKRRSLYKILAQKGLVIDCAVPQGGRKAERAVQEEVLKDQARQILSKTGKSMDKVTYNALVEKTGFDLFTFTNNLEKLVNYVGDRKQITVADTEAVLTRTRLDPIYALTNAIADRDLEKALYLLKSLFASGVHPLQALAAIMNQTRKLLRIKGLTGRLEKRIWHAGTTFNQFKTKAVPAIQKDDSDLKKVFSDWLILTNTISNGSDEKKSGGGKKKSAPKDTDLQILKSPGNPYPVYRSFLQSENFSKEDLIRGLERLAEADLLLKSTAQNPKLILERVVFEICQSKEGL